MKLKINNQGELENSQILEILIHNLKGSKKISQIKKYPKWKWKDNMPKYMDAEKKNSAQRKIYDCKCLH